MPVVVGVIVALVFIFSFSGWFYNLIAGWGEFVLDDAFFKYRIISACLISLVLVTGTFLGLAYAYECPNEEREGIFASLNCDDFRRIKASAESTFRKETVAVPKEEDQIEDDSVYIFDQTN